MSDETLIKKCQKGDPEAFEKLINLHYDTIYRYAYKWCLDQNNAQDITQLACIKLARSISQFQFKSSFTSWLYRLVINCGKDFYKSPSQYSKDDGNNSVSEKLQSTQDTASRRIYAQQIMRHIDELQNELKDALILVFVKGMTHQQAATELGVKESTISWRIHEARKTLKDQFTSPELTTHLPTENGVGGLA